MLTDNHCAQEQPCAATDDLLLELAHQLIDLSHAIEHRFEGESLSDVRRALLATQDTLNRACAAVIPQP